MKNFAKNIASLFVALMVGFFSTAAFADDCKPTTCPTTCSAGSSSDCGRKYDAGCMVEQNQKTQGGTCFNNVPVSGAESVSSQCASGAENTSSGTNFPVTLKDGNEQIYVKAAAKGKVVYAGITVDGGRTVIIEHTKGCTDNGHGDSGKYHTIYRHLQSINVYQLQEVNMNDIIGIVGGSTATEGGSLCDNKEQASLPGYTNSGCTTAKAEDVHLNFEVIDGPAAGSSSAAASSAALNSNCSEIQNMCGSCSSDISICLSETPASYRDYSVASTSVTYRDSSSKASKTNCESGISLDPESCLFCTLFKDIFNAASTIAKTANDGLAIPTRNLVGIGFCIWLAIFVLRNITSFGAIKTGDMVKSVIFQGFRVTVVMLILSGALYQVMDLTLSPVLQTGLSFTRSLNTNSTCPSDAEYLKGISGYDANKGFQKDSTGGLSIQVGTALVCSIKKIEDSVSKMMSYGRYSACLSFHDFKALGFVPHAGFLTTGAFLYIVGVALLLMFPWFLIDCLLQLCISVALLPCAIGAFAFKITAKYLKTLWDYFMNAMFNFVFISIIIFIITANFKTWMGYDFEADAVDPNIFINATGNGLAWWGTTAFRILGICFFCFIFLDEAKSMADKFASAPTLGGGRGIGTMFGGLAASTGVSLGTPAVTALGNMGTALGESGESLFGAQTRSMSNHTMGALSRLTGGQKITDENGNTVGYRTSRKFFGMTYEANYTKDEQGLWTSSVTLGRVTTIKDTIMETELIKDKDGNVIGIKTKAENVSSKYMINDDKTINQNAVDQLMNNAQNKEYAARHIISTVMADRGMQLDNRFLSSQTTINDDGSWTITQKNEDGKLQTINARIENGKMIIQSDIDDGSGKIKSTISDGLTKRTETHNRSE